MIPHHSDGWRTLGKDDPMVVSHNAVLGWRKRTDYGAVYVFEYHLPTEPGKYKRRFLMEVSVSAEPCEGRITVDLPVLTLTDQFKRIENLLVSLGVALGYGLKGVRP